MNYPNIRKRGGRGFRGIEGRTREKDSQNLVINNFPKGDSGWAKLKNLFLGI